MEILLDDRGVCNLSEVVVPNHIIDGKIDLDSIKNAVQLATRHALRITNVTIEIPSWDIIQKRDRLLGVSLDGWCEAMDILDYDEENKIRLLHTLDEVVQNEANMYAHEMRVPTPLLVTTIKPSGSLAQLPTVSSGIHRSFAPYYIRRVRINATDPLARVMLESGFPVFPETGQGPSAEEFNKLSSYDKLDILQKANTWVIEFPVSTSTTVNAYSESAIDQYERYCMFQKHWTDHNTSITIYVGEDEWEPLFEHIHNTWDDYICVSFLPKDKNIYPLAPYEEISEEEYNRRASVLKDIEDLNAKLIRIESSDLATELLDEGCESGICPVR